MNQPYELQSQGSLPFVLRLNSAHILQTLPQTTVVEQRLLYISLHLALHDIMHCSGPASDNCG